MNRLISRILASPNTSVCGVILLICELGKVWLPSYKQQFEATEGIAMAYGLLMAGDSKPKNNEKEPPTYS